MRVAGLISGTSVDGIDTAVVDIGESIQVVASATVPYPPEVREAILSVSNAATHTATIARLNFLIGELFADALKQTGVPLETIELIGSHGQTIFHEGEPVEFLGRKIASTLQIGEAAVIAERTGIETIADFRTADMAAGGKGAPLVPFLDYQLFRHVELSRVALNIGGIANITVIPAAAKPEDVIAFDTGPGNMVIDALAPPFDRDGAQARAGSVNQTLLDQLLADPYYRRDPPKSCGREQYGADFIARTKIDVATATELTARTIARAVSRYPTTREVIVSGGGAHNRYLMERLTALCSARTPACRVPTHGDAVPGFIRVTTSTEFGIGVDSKEAILFAVLAYQTHQRRASNLPSATGARKPKVLGKISLP
ncbi:MAG TPA: anhydro-N-acetylmuramic acid kinase [Bryobacteraceae bacterium]|nr:anhydro-N-acetylmuramic acid kinase [Bryobacteraceae bacterium]